jgi:hypothetical protein
MAQEISFPCGCSDSRTEENRFAGGYSFSALSEPYNYLVRSLNACQRIIFQKTGIIAIVFLTKALNLRLDS